MTWKNILKEDEEDHYEYETKEVIEDFNIAKNNMEEMKKRFEEIESVVEEYADLVLKFDEEVMKLTRFNDRLGYEGKSANEFRDKVFEKYTYEAYDNAKKINAPAVKIAEKLFEYRNIRF